MSASDDLRRTHDWSMAVDREHLSDVQQRAAELAPSGVLHLVLEVLANANEEAAESGRIGRATVRLLGGGWVEVGDDGRGTSTRIGPDGQAIRKPIMATRDLRFFDAPDSPLLPDGCPRRGISIVAAMSAELVHENHRVEGSWSQRYRHGEPVGGLELLPARSATGTVVRFLPDRSLVALDEGRVRQVVGQFPALTVEVTSDRRSRYA